MHNPIMRAYHRHAFKGAYKSALRAHGDHEMWKNEIKHGEKLFNTPYLSDGEQKKFKYYQANSAHAEMTKHLATAHKYGLHPEEDKRWQTQT